MMFLAGFFVGLLGGACLGIIISESCQIPFRWQNADYEDDNERS